MSTKNESDCVTDGRNFREHYGRNNRVLDIIQLDSSDESVEIDKSRDRKFWQLMRAYAQRKVKVHSYSFHQQQFYAIGSALVHSKAKTNLRKCVDSNVYCDVGSVIQLCIAIKTSTYGIYLKRLSRHKFRCFLAVGEPIFQQMKPYLLGETETQPFAIDPNGPMPLLKEAPLIDNKRLQKKASVSSTTAPTRDVNEQMTIDGIAGEFFENPCYMEFLMNWLMHTNLECIKNISVVKLTTEQKVELNATDGNCHHVFMTINHLPASHFFGAGFGLDQKKAFWAASRSIVRRLYHAGFVTPVLYHTIGKPNRSEFSGKIKRCRRMKEWKIVKSVVERFRKTMTARMPHWVQLTKNGFNNEESMKIIDELLGANRIIAQKHEMKADGFVKSKRKADKSTIDLLKARHTFSEKETDEIKREREVNFPNFLNMPSTSSAFIPDSEMSLYEKQKAILKRGFDSTKNSLHVFKTETALINNKNPNYGDYAALEHKKAKSMLTFENDSVGNNVRGNLVSYEVTDDADVILEDEVILPSVNMHTNSMLSPFFNSSISKYGISCLELGVSYMEETLAVRSIIKEKRASFAEEFKSFDEHIWRHFQINGQDDRTFSWKMTVRQKLLALVRQVYKDSNLVAVGSTVNGCGSYNSDMDLCICQPYKNHSFEANRSYSIHVLRKLHKKFVTDWRQMFKICQYIPAKVPIIKLEMAAPYEELEIDINCNNVAGIYNSHLLHYYSRVDDRFPALCLLVKHWAINAGINNAMMGTLNSYSLILMVLHFLQCGALPPVLPNLQFLYPDLFNATCSIDSLELFRDLPHPLPPRELNNETIGELLIAFFDYYARFDFKNKAISIRNGCVYGRELLSENTMRFKIFIEEPYDQKNTARCVTSIENLQLIREAFTSARNAFLQASAGPPSLECIGVR
ncbi:Poly(A) RNA polymerase GLD2 [Dirofilaria immitis]